MPRTLDTRSYTASSDARYITRGSDSAELSPLTGNPTRVALPVMRGAAEDNLIDAARRVLREQSATLGFTSRGEGDEFTPAAPLYTSAGGATVHMQQHHNGIPVFEMTRAVRFDVEKQPSEILGDSVELPYDAPTEPQLTAAAAAQAAARFLSEPEHEAASRTDRWGRRSAAPDHDFTSYIPSVKEASSGPQQRTVLSAGPFAESVPAHLAYLYQNPKARLCWQLTLTLPGFASQYVVLIGADAETAGQVLYCQRTSSHAAGYVCRHNPAETPCERVTFPPARLGYADNPWRTAPSVFPPPWVDQEHADGPSTVAYEAESEKKLAARREAGDAIFGAAAQPGAEVGMDALLTNAFYFCNYLHDFFALFGFDDAAGNFERSPSGDGDRVVVRVYPEEVYGTANMTTSAEGRGAVMRLGRLGKRHTALDADVVFHEFAHGVSNRLVGGPADDRALLQPQSRGMGEGWSDYFALTLQNYFRAAGSEKTTSGGWLVGDARGIREFPYDEHFPDDFSSIAGGRYLADEHNVGEVWCAILMSMDRALIGALGDRGRGRTLGWQLVLDGMKLCRANPSFLDARQGIAQALDDLLAAKRIDAADYAAVKKALWKTFARFGMGPAARSAGARLQGIAADYQEPAHLVAA